MSIVETLMSQLQSGGLAEVSKQTGLGERETARVAAGALPALLAGLSRNAGDGAGASALLGALDRDHDGSVLDDLGGFLGSGRAESAGSGILPHVFGDRQDTVREGLGRLGGVDGAKAGRVLSMLAPLVMGALAKARQEKDLDASGLGDLLGGETSALGSSAGGGLDLVKGLLDADGDGSVADDLADRGRDLLGKLF